MPREHARILTRVWSDDDFCARTAGAQRLYMLMLSQPSINNAGVLPLTIRRWANKAPDTHAADVEKALQELVEHFYVVVDRDTEEVLVRSFMRNDGVWKQPRVLKNACGVALHVESQAIRTELAVEFRRIGVADAVTTADVLDPGKNASPLRLAGTLNEGSAEASPRVGDDQPEPIATGYGVGEGVACEDHGSSSVGGDVPSEVADAPADDEVHRDDVEALCKHLADRIEGNGSKRPTITPKWRKEARLLLDRDKRDLEKTHNLIDWSQDHHHWKTRVMAMPKFRSEYDAMRLQALEDHKRQRGQRPGGPRPSASDAAAAQAQSLRRTPREPAPDRPPQPQLRLPSGAL